MILTPTNVPGRFYCPQVETSHIVLPPMFAPGSINQRCNAMCIQNAGNVDAILGGAFTLTPGQSIWLGNYNELSVIRVQMQVSFDLDSTPDVPAPRVEIIMVQANISGSGFYIDQPAAR